MCLADISAHEVVNNIKDIPAKIYIGVYRALPRECTIPRKDASSNQSCYNLEYYYGTNIDNDAVTNGIEQLHNAAGKCYRSIKLFELYILNNVCPLLWTQSTSSSSVCCLAFSGCNFTSLHAVKKSAKWWFLLCTFLELEYMYMHCDGQAQNAML